MRDPGSGIRDPGSGVRGVRGSELPLPTAAGCSDRRRQRLSAAVVPEETILLAAEGAAALHERPGVKDQRLLPCIEAHLAIARLQGVAVEDDDRPTLRAR